MISIVIIIFNKRRVKVEFKYNEKIFNVPNSLVTRGYDDLDLSDYRTEFMRDRDRVLYSTAFRRLAGKTQIYTVGSDDHKRNRLTHSLEVSQIARTIAIGLGFNEYLAEAIALSHDFGHAPFGHAGEQMLNEIMFPSSKYVKNSPFNKSCANNIKLIFEKECKKHMDYMNYAFGFKHNLQSVRVCVRLEDSYRDINSNNIGLNLTNYTLFGVMVHSKLKYKKEDTYPNFQNEFKKLLRQKGSNKLAWSFEAFIVSLADEVAQWHHDLEDALRGNAIPLNTICQTIKDALNDELTENDKNIISDINNILIADRKCIASLSHIVINTLINDIIENSKNNLKKLYDDCIENYNIHSSESFFDKFDFDSSEIKNVISLSEKIDISGFEKIIKGSIHHSKNVERMNEKGKYIIRKLFEAYYAHPQQLSDGAILHILVDTQYENTESNRTYKNIDEAIKNGIGVARMDFDELIRNPNIWVKCILMRRICDHIASMTDHYAIDEYNSLYG